MKSKNQKKHLVFAIGASDRCHWIATIKQILIYSNENNYSVVEDKLINGIKIPMTLTEKQIKNLDSVGVVYYYNDKSKNTVIKVCSNGILREFSQL